MLFCFQHEQASVQMFDYLVEDNNLVEEFAKYGLLGQDRTFIKEQVAGPIPGAGKQAVRIQI